MPQMIVQIGNATPGSAFRIRITQLFEGIPQDDQKDLLLPEFSTF